MPGISKRKINILIATVVLLTIFLISLVIAAYDNKIKRIEKNEGPPSNSQNITSENQN